MMDNKVKGQANHLYKLLEWNYKNNIVITFGISYLYSIRENKKCSYHLTEDTHYTYFKDFLSEDHDIQHAIDVMIIELMEYFKHDKIKR